MSEIRKSVPDYMRARVRLWHPRVVLLPCTIMAAIGADRTCGVDSSRLPAALMTQLTRCAISSS
jgi:hypothetical protein